MPKQLRRRGVTRVHAPRQVTRSPMRAGRAAAAGAAPEGGKWAGAGGLELVPRRPAGSMRCGHAPEILKIAGEHGRCVAPSYAGAQVLPAEFELPEFASARTELGERCGGGEGGTDCHSPLSSTAMGILCTKHSDVRWNDRTTLV